MAAVFRNALIPIMTGFPAASSRRSSPVSADRDRCFSLDGLGLLSYESVIRRLSGGCSAVFRLHHHRSPTHLIRDLSYVWVDPR